MSDLELHIYGGEGTRETSILYCTPHIHWARSHALKLELLRARILLPDKLLPFGLFWTIALHAGSTRVAKRSGLVPRHRRRRLRVGRHGLGSSPALGADRSPLALIRTAKPESEPRQARTHNGTGPVPLTFAVPASPAKRRTSAGGVSSAAPPRPSGGGVGVAVALFCARSGRQTGDPCLRARVNKHRPCPAAAGRGGKPQVRCCWRRAARPHPHTPQAPPPAELSSRLPQRGVRYTGPGLYQCRAIRSPALASTVNCRVPAQPPLARDTAFTARHRLQRFITVVICCEGNLGSRFPAGGSLSFTLYNTGLRLQRCTYRCASTARSGTEVVRTCMLARSRGQSTSAQQDKAVN